MRIREAERPWPARISRRSGSRIGSYGNEPQIAISSDEAAMGANPRLIIHHNYLKAIFIRPFLIDLGGPSWT
jgi:hypothetical protein